MVKSLNAISEKDKIFFYCDSLGKIVLPTDTSIISIHTPDELPEKERELYRKHWTNYYGAKSYVVSYEGEASLAIGFLFCSTFLENVLERCVTDNDMNVFYNIVKSYANSMEKYRMLDECSILVGENTDPSGHEIYVIVPYDKKDRFESILQLLDRVVYKDVEYYIKTCFLDNSIGFNLIEKLKYVINEHGFELKEDGTASGAAEIQVHSLWVAACLYLDWEPDTAAYDNTLFKIWTENISDRISFDAFDMFMCEGLG